MEMEKHLKKALMWYKVKELRSDGLNKSQIAQEVGICRKTVRRYLGMNEKEFHLWIRQTRSLPKKLQAYYQFIANLLEDKPYLSSAQIEDRLKEHFRNLPSVHSKTVYNFVQNIRKERNIPKPKSEKRRDFQKIPELDYGNEAQVDFGVYNMIKQSGGRQKVWFFAMVLSRSRQKFVYFQSSPFTAASSVYAHQLAFDFYQGCPQKVLYDQDRVFMVDENLGDLLLTDELRRYVSSEDFEAVFCRKADPQSKGKVENVVGYVKKNFLRGREFVNADSLNEAALAWLSRTGNAKKHSGTLKTPQKEWEIEKKYLLKIKQKRPQPSESIFKEYHVLKDNTIKYRSNFYSLPVGTYKGHKTKILLSIKDDNLFIYDSDKNLITSHTICILQGKYIRKTDHVRDKSKTLNENRIKSIEILGNTAPAKLFILRIEQNKKRYLHDNLRAIIKGINTDCQLTIQKALAICLEHKLYNANKLIELVNFHKQQNKQNVDFDLSKINLPQEAMEMPKTSNIQTYENLF